MSQTSKPSPSTLERQSFSTGRAAEYFDASELEKLTGQPRRNFASVVLKELVDNALDAAETAGRVPQLEIEVNRTEGFLTLAVSDNGLGLSTEQVQKILDFETRTSDKAVYKTPTRGAQGNALKTILGLPYAVGVDAPVVIETQGHRHQIRAYVTPGGAVKVAHEHTLSSRQGGARFEITLSEVQVDHTGWARAFSLFNPHATVKISAFDGCSEQANSGAKNAEIYQSQVDFPASWRKFLPTDLPSAWWFNPSDFAALVYAYIAHGDDLTLRDFIRQFRGLSGNTKAKAVAAQLGGVSRVAELEHQPQLIPVLHKSLCDAATPPSANVLGLVGPEHFERCFNDWYGVERYWYKKATGVVDGLPFAFEVAVAQTQRPGDVYHALNFSPTFDDPFKGSRFKAEDVVSDGAINFLRDQHALSSQDWDIDSAVAYHLTCPSLTMLDRGKTNVDISAEQGAAVATALFKACKELHAEYKRFKRDAAAAERRASERARTQRRYDFSLKEAVAATLPEAYRAATDDSSYAVSARDFYYVVRERIQSYTQKSLDFNYFSQNLLVKYQRRHGAFPLLYYKPRGILYEPHTGREIPLGTREVKEYEFPTWVYNKILYVEKDGVGEGLKPLAERYDMAIVSAEGYASEAARVLFAQADKEQHYQLFVLHDADPHGYNIARTLAEETARMPEHSVEVIDLGFRLEEALELGLLTETFTRKNALPSGLKLNDAERVRFSGTPKGKKSWICQRVELNALRPSQRLEYVERKLKEHGATAKVIPPTPVLTQAAREQAEVLTRSVLERQLAALLDLDNLAAELAPELLSETLTMITSDATARRLEQSPEQLWRQAVVAPLQETLQTVNSADMVDTALINALYERLARLEKGS